MTAYEDRDRGRRIQSFCHRCGRALYLPTAAGMNAPPRCVGCGDTPVDCICPDTREPA